MLLYTRVPTSQRVDSHQEIATRMQQFYCRPPSRETITRFLNEQSEQPFTYKAVGATATRPPAGYTVDHNRIQLGYGTATYQQACAALAQWTMFELGWVEPYWPTTPITVGAPVGVIARLPGLYILNACRIVYTVQEETADGARFGFAYGTLPGHIERGEERFYVEWRRPDDSVWYDILAFSQPNHWLVWLGYPVTRYFQRRFARDSKAAMWRAVHRE